MATTLEQTTCYKCGEKIEAEVGQVHPLCSECQDEHDRWFAEQMRMFK